ncbi:hypothetical protein ACCO45_002621 [Purpureocillium lilacinum]|uniref:Uncharacterized protein n=1 Tax=Purpureocillium lilacinum TaxID=33203 RepID=A0ACC4EAK8_PURLI
MVLGPRSMAVSPKTVDEDDVGRSVSWVVHDVETKHGWRGRGTATASATNAGRGEELPRPRDEYRGTSELEPKLEASDVFRSGSLLLFDFDSRKRLSWHNNPGTSDTDKVQKWERESPRDGREAGSGRLVTPMRWPA